jgi:tRNA(fMet)-specific endonuclease VapC
MFLLDTNIVLHYLKGLPSVAERLLATPRSETAVSAVTILELEYGTRKAPAARRRKTISEFLKGVPQISFDAACANEAADIRIDLESRGLIIGPMDLLIAGTAVSRGAILVTANTKEFARVRGLRLADWTKPPAVH